MVAEKPLVIWKLVIWKPVEPVLVKLALCGALEVPINCPPKGQAIGRNVCGGSVHDFIDTQINRADNARIAVEIRSRQAGRRIITGINGWRSDLQMEIIIGGTHEERIGGEIPWVCGGVTNAYPG